MARSGATATVFLTGRECPWRCTMCDLWQHTTVADTPPGAIPAQIAAARTELARSARGVTCLKLYNAGSFFDPRAVPQADYDAIAAQLAGLPHVIVESHPALIGAGLDRFLDALARARPAAANAPRLEVAMGLESAHPGVLDRLNKGLTLDGFAAASAALRGARRRVAGLPARRAAVPRAPDWSDETGREPGRVAAPLDRHRVCLRRHGRLAHPDPVRQRRDGGPRGRGPLSSSDTHRHRAQRGAGARPRESSRPDLHGRLGSRSLRGVPRLSRGATHASRAQ